MNIFLVASLFLILNRVMWVQLIRKCGEKPSSVFGQKFGGTLRGDNGLIEGKFSQGRIGRFENVEKNLRASSDENSEEPFGVTTG